MGITCCIVGCSRTQRKALGIRMFRVPVNPDRRRLWKAAINRAPPFDIQEWHRVCDIHFISGSPSSDPLNVDYIPSQGLGYVKRTDGDGRGARSIARYERHQKREVVIEQEPEVETGVGVQTDPVYRLLAEKRTQTVESGNSFEQLKKDYELLERAHFSQSEQLRITVEAYEELEKENIFLKKDLEALNEKYAKSRRVSYNLTETINKKVIGNNYIVGNDKKTQFYTGLPYYETFRNLCDSLKDYVIDTVQSKLSCYDTLLMVLMKLKLNLTFEDLGQRFGVNKSTASTYFHRWLDVLYVHIGGIVKWPTTDHMQLPDAFQLPDFVKTKVIIDCFEIFVERPTALKARAQTWSNYKSHNTVKILIGISPSGSVTFLSKVWGGRVSDKKLTLESGLLDMLNPGDVVLADRGFTVEDEFEAKQVRLLVPAFTRGKKQLAAQDVERTRQLARVRIHVERVIKRCRDYKILKGPIPVSLVKKKTDGELTTVDKVVRVCCALTNLSQPCLSS